MPFEKFLNAYNCTEDRTPGSPPKIKGTVGEVVAKVIAGLGGKTFEEGLYRVLRGDEVIEATQAAWAIFPQHAKTIVVFGYDWQGRQFAADAKRMSDGLPQVLLLDVSYGEVFEVPCDPITFHNTEAVEYPDDTLGRAGFQEWKASNPTAIQHSECVGYEVSPFLGGEDDMENMEVSDLSVYWHLCGEIRSQIEDLDDGDEISDISIDD